MRGTPHGTPIAIRARLALLLHGSALYEYGRSTKGFDQRLLHSDNSLG